MANAAERDEDVEHDGRTCGRTSRYTLGDYLRSDKTALYWLISVFRIERSTVFLPVGAEAKDGAAVMKRSDFKIPLGKMATSR